MQAVDPEKRGITPYEAYTGQIPDVSKMVTCPGYSCYIPRHDGKASSLRPAAAAAIYVCPADPIPGQLVVPLHSLKVTVINQVFALNDPHAYTASLAANSLFVPGVTLVPYPRLPFLQALADILAPQKGPRDYMVITSDPITGHPMTVQELAPDFDEHGDLTMIPKNPTPPPQQKTPTPMPAQDSDGEEQIFQRIGDGQGPRLPQHQWSQFLQLDRDKPVQVDRYAKAPKGGGLPSKSHERLTQYGKARTIDQLKRFHPGPPPLWADDMKNDLHRGYITIDQKALNLPAPFFTAPPTRDRFAMEGRP